MDNIGAVSEMLLDARRVVFMTGAGISTESGIPDFRSPGGIWDRFDPSEFTYDRFLHSESSRRKFWDFYCWLWARLANAAPNRGHLALAELYSMGKVESLITQNADNLHQVSGIPGEKIIELHGTLNQVVCLECASRYDKEEIRRRLELGERDIRCRCGGLLKPCTVTFGQALPAEALHEAQEQAASCDLFIVAGSSLMVHPAAQIPYIAKDNGARLVIINLTATPHDPYSDVVIRDKIGKSLSQIARRVRVWSRKHTGVL